MLTYGLFVVAENAFRDVGQTQLLCIIGQHEKPIYIRAAAHYGRVLFVHLEIYLLLFCSDKHRDNGARHHNEHSARVDIGEQRNDSRKTDEIAHKVREIVHRSRSVSIGILHCKDKIIIELGIIVHLEFYHARLLEQVGLNVHMQLLRELRHYIRRRQKIPQP